MENSVLFKIVLQIIMWYTNWVKVDNGIPKNLIFIGFFFQIHLEQTLF